MELFVNNNPAHGWYISDNNGAYLRKDGTIGESTLDKSGIYAYWPTEQEAKNFLKEWKNETN